MSTASTKTKARRPLTHANCLARPNRRHRSPGRRLNAPEPAILANRSYRVGTADGENGSKRPKGWRPQCVSRRPVHLRAPGASLLGSPKWRERKATPDCAPQAILESKTVRATG